MSAKFLFSSSKWGLQGKRLQRIKQGGRRNTGGKGESEIGREIAIAYASYTLKRSIGSQKYMRWKKSSRKLRSEVAKGATSQFGVKEV